MQTYCQLTFKINSEEENIKIKNKKILKNKNKKSAIMSLAGA